MSHPTDFCDKCKKEYREESFSSVGNLIFCKYCEDDEEEFDFDFDSEIENGFQELSK